MRNIFTIVLLLSFFQLEATPHQNDLYLICRTYGLYKYQTKINEVVLNSWVDSSINSCILSDNFDINVVVRNISASFPQKRIYRGHHLFNSYSDSCIVNYSWINNKELSDTNKLSLNRITCSHPKVNYKSKAEQINKYYLNTSINELIPIYFFPINDSLSFVQIMHCFFDLFNIYIYYYPHKSLFLSDEDAFNNMLSFIIVGKDYSLLDAQGIFQRIICTLHDPHATPISYYAFSKSCASPVPIKIIDSNCYIQINSRFYLNEDADSLTPLKVISVNNKKCAYILDSLKDVISFSSELCFEHRAESQLLTYLDDTMKIIFSFNRGEDSLIIPLSKAYMPPSSPDYFVSDKYFYINYHFFSRENMRTIDQLLHSNANKPLILDFRTYPSMSPDLISNFFETTKKHILDYYQVQFNTPGIYLKKAIYSKNSRGRFRFNNQVIALIDEQTISASEWHLLFFKYAYSRILLVGRNTCGAPSTMYSFQVLPGYMTFLTGDNIQDIQGLSYQRIGISPDRYVSKDSDFNNDEILETAVKIIDNE